MATDAATKRAQGKALLEAIADQYASYQGPQLINPQWGWYRKHFGGTTSFPEVNATRKNAENIDASRLFQARQRAAADLGKSIYDLTNAEVAPYLAATGLPNTFQARLIKDGLFTSDEDKEFIQRLNTFLDASDNTHWYNPFKFADNQSFFDSEGFKGLSFDDQIEFLHELVDDKNKGLYAVKTDEDLDDYHQRIGRAAAEFGIRKTRENADKLRQAIAEQKSQEIAKRLKPNVFGTTEVNLDKVAISTPKYDRPAYTIHEVDPKLDEIDKAQYYRSKEFDKKVLDSLRSTSNKTPTRAKTDTSHIKFFI